MTQFEKAKFNSKANTKEYEDNYDKIFSKTCQHCGMKQTQRSNVLCQSCGKEVSNGSDVQRTL